MKGLRQTGTTQTDGRQSMGIDFLILEEMDERVSMANPFCGRHFGAARGLSVILRPGIRFC
jgi:hypothetical protein